MRIVLELLKENILNNISQIYNSVNKPIIAVVKANAYGMGSVEVSKVLDDNPYVKSFAVACIEEAVELREVDIKKPILVLGGVLDLKDVEYLKHYKLTPVISSAYQFDMIKDAGIDFHVKFDTGMGRLGFFELQEDIANHPNLKGIMTHLASPLDKEYSAFQIQKFKNIVKSLKRNSIEIHYQSSAGLMYEKDFTTAIRIGLAMYGEKPYEGFDIPIKPIYKVKAKVISLKNFKKGDKISYGGTYTLSKDATIGVVSMGYADGIPKALANKWYFDFNGVKLPMVGAVTMDMTMFELPEGVNIKIGDYVDFVNEKQTFSMASKIVKTIPYELMCRMGKRVKRVVV